MKNIFNLFILSFGLINAAPSVQIIPYPGVQEANTNNPVVYFKVSFSEVVTDFSNSDLIVGGTSGAQTGFINEQLLDSFDGQNFMIQVDVGALSSGTVTLFVPAGVAIGGGDFNTASNVCTINYQIPVVNCSSYNGTQFNPFQINYEYDKNKPLESCNNLPRVAAIDTPLVNGRFLRVNNFTPSSVCVGATIIRQNATSYPFYVVKSYQMSTIVEVLENFKGNSYTVEGLETLNGAGQAYKCVNFNLATGEFAYVVVATQNTDFYMYLDGLDCAALSVDDVVSEVSFDVLPNPNDGFFEIKGISFDQAKVYNLMGQLIHETNQSILHLEHLSKGTYLLEIIQGNSKKTKKIVIN